MTESKQEWARLMRKQLLSRVLAVIITAFLFAAVGLDFDKSEREAIYAFSTLDDLRAHNESSLLQSYWACFGMVLLVGFGYIAMVEALAFLLRLATSQLSKFVAPRESSL